MNRGVGWDPENVDVNDGAIAPGHPAGASGIRGLVTLPRDVVKRDAKKRLATLCFCCGTGVAARSTPLADTPRGKA